MLISYLLQLLPAFKGKIRIGRFLMKSIPDLKKRRVLPLNSGMQFSLPSLEDSIAYELFINGIYDKRLVDYLIKGIPQNGIFVDIGANIGAISVIVAKRRPDISVYAFEASPHIFDELIKNYLLNKVHNIKCINKAVWHTDKLMLDFFAPYDQFGKGSASPNYTNESEQVETVRLDSFLVDNRVCPDIIKIDVQGYEICVLEGLQKYLPVAGKKPIIIFEFEHWAEEIAFGNENVGKARQLLTSWGYHVMEFDRVSNPGPRTKIDPRKLIAFPGAKINDQMINNQ